MKKNKHIPNRVVAQERSKDAVCLEHRRFMVEGLVVFKVGQLLVSGRFKEEGLC